MRLEDIKTMVYIIDYLKKGDLDKIQDLYSHIRDTICPLIDDVYDTQTIKTYPVSKFIILVRDGDRFIRIRSGKKTKRDKNQSIQERNIWESYNIIIQDINRNDKILLSLGSGKISFGHHQKRMGMFLSSSANANKFMNNLGGFVRKLKLSIVIDSV